MSVKPSWQVTKLMLCSGSRSSCPNTSGLPVSRNASEWTVPAVALHEGPDVVTKPAVPFLPTVAEEGADLVEAGGVPRFRDQLDVGEHRVRLDVPEQRRRGHRAAPLVAAQDRGQIEAEAVHVHLGDPVVEAVENQPAHDRLVGVQRVAAAAVVGEGRRVVVQDVVGVVGETAEAHASDRPAPPSVVWL